MSSGSSGWGPPPPSPAPSGGWGPPPPPNPSASAAWGASEEPEAATSTSNSNLTTTPAATSAPPTAASTSWAAAAGKGLPPSEAAPSNGATPNTSNNSKQLEQLNSVREALFSQDGWGCNNVKQDTAWDVDGVSPSAPLKESMWGAANMSARNDGTDLWKSTLSGQPPMPKPQSSSPWSHVPQNPADYKNWGEDDDPSSMHMNGPANEPLWRPDQPGPGSNQYGKPWKSDMRAGPGWSDGGPMGGAMGRDMRGRNDNASWGMAPRMGNPQWSNAPSPRWVDHESPIMGRRPMPSDDGPAMWGGQKPNMHMQQPPGVSHWKEMPMPGGMGMPRGPQMPSRMSTPGMGTDGWGHPARGGWGDPMDGPVVPGWAGNRGMAGSMGGMRTSPNWDDSVGMGPTDMGPGWPKSQQEPPNMLTKEKIYSSKQFRMLCDMGYRKEEVEATLRANNMRLEETLEYLTQHARGPNRAMMADPMMRPESPHFGGPAGGVQFSLDPSMPPQPNLAGVSNVPPPNKLLGPQPGGSPVPLPSASLLGANLPGPGRQQAGGQQSQQQPSASKLRLLVQQIQMAVSAGHLNPQILNQPLAPQTLLLLNDLLQQIKTLQTLQQQHAVTARNSPNNSTALMTLTVNITKAKQQIQNLQNQITLQQANYLKAQSGQQMGNASALFPANASSLSASSGGDTSAVQEMYQGLSLLGGASSDRNNSNGSRLAQWKNNASAFQKAPGTKSASNLLLDDTNTLWARNSNPSEINGGWPNSGHKSGDQSEFAIPEFEPGKPWKGSSLMKNPDEDPSLTPGSVAPSALALGAQMSKTASTPSIATTSLPSTVADGVGQLGLTSSTWSYGHNSAAATPTKSSDTWSQGVNNGSGLTQIGQDLWGSKSSTMSRAPPGINQWPSVSSASNGWTNNGQLQDTNSEAASSTSVSNQNAVVGGNNNGPCWLLLKNLTPQIDGSTLKTLCIQHGPLQHFDLYLNHSIALVLYASPREAAKAQKALNNCLLGNTTIHAATTTENDISSILQQLGVATPSCNTSGPVAASVTSVVTKTAELWGNSNAASTSVSLSSAVPAASSSPAGPLFNTGSSVWGAPEVIGDASGGAQQQQQQLNSFLPGDLLGENSI